MRTTMQAQCYGDLLFHDQNWNRPLLYKPRSHPYSRFVGPVLANVGKFLRPYRRVAQQINVLPIHGAFPYPPLTWVRTCCVVNIPSSFFSTAKNSLIPLDYYRACVTPRRRAARESEERRQTTSSECEIEGPLVFRRASKYPIHPTCAYRVGRQVSRIKNRIVEDEYLCLVIVGARSRCKTRRFRTKGL